MELEDEILLESRFPAKNMCVDTRNLCLTLIKNTKEVESSTRVIDATDPFELITISFEKINNIVSFNGFIGNKYENKIIDGTIYIINGKYHVKTNIYRLYEHLDDEVKMYSVEDVFEISEDKTMRKSTYSDGVIYWDELLPLSNVEQDSYIDEIVRKLKMNK